MTTVLHLVERWLDLSAGFVAGHVAHSGTRGVVVSRQPFAHLDAFPHRPRRSLAALDAVPAGVRDRAVGLAVEAAAVAYRADLVHVHFGYPAHAALPAVRRRGLPLVLSLHGDDATALPHRHPHHYEPVVPLTAAVVVPSRFLAAAAERLGFPAERVHVVPAGIDTAFFTPAPLPDGPPVVAHVGRLVPKKGLDVLLAAWPRVRAAVPDAELRVLGDGPLRPLLADPGEGVWHVLPDPARRREQVRDVLRAATVVAAPSRTAPDGDAESLLLVNVEAMASGRPVVSTRHGGIPEYVDDGRTGLLVDEGDAAALAVALTTLLTDRDRAQRMAAAGVAAAAELDVRRCSTRLDAIYAELLAKWPSRTGTRTARTKPTA